MAISTPNMTGQSWEQWKGIEPDEPTVIASGQDTKNSFDIRWRQTQKAVTDAGQIATSQAIEAVFPKTEA